MWGRPGTNGTALARSRHRALWWRSIAALPGGGALSVSLAINLAWLPISLDAALLVAIVAAVPIWTIFSFYCFWSASVRRTWALLALLAAPSLTLNLARVYAG